MIKSEYPKVRIQISTIGIKNSIKLVEQLIELDKLYDDEWLELQFSIHSTDMTFRRWLQTDAILSNSAINELAAKFYLAKPNRKWKVTLNFAVAVDTPFVIQDLRKDFDPSVVFIKVSPINSNPVSEDNGLKSLFEYHNAI
jgi:adenine C2-methylase RlmN of 23S rRNA A2503 and tRNA A37